MSLVTLTFRDIVKKYIHMGITIFQIFIWDGISSNIRSEIIFYGDANVKQNLRPHIPRYTTQIKNLDTGLDLGTP